jgi:hypothetical protein
VDERQHLSLRRLSQHRCGDPRRVAGGLTCRHSISPNLPCCSTRWRSPIRLIPSSSLAAPT